MHLEGEHYLELFYPLGRWWFFYKFAIAACGSEKTSYKLVQGRRRRGGWGGYGRPSFSLLSASAHARIISLAVVLKYVASG